MSNRAAVMKLPTDNEVAETFLRAIQLNRRELVNMLGAQCGKDKLLQFCELMNAQYEVLETSVTLFLAKQQQMREVQNASQKPSTTEVHGSGAREEEGRQVDQDRNVDEAARGVRVNKKKRPAK